MIRQPRVVSHQLTSARWTRCLAMIVCQVLVWQPMVASAVIAQQPMFTVSSAPPNVMLMMDDSSSMAGHRLPTPPTVTVPAAVSVSVRYGAGIRGQSTRPTNSHCARLHSIRSGTTHRFTTYRGMTTTSRCPRRARVIRLWRTTFRMRTSAGQRTFMTSPK